MCGGQGAQAVLGPPAMSEQAHYGAQMCSGTNPRKCQDLGDLILLLLGSFILFNVGINVVTLLWRHLKSSLRILFHHFFSKDKQSGSLSNHPVCMHCSVDPKNLGSRISSYFHHRPSFLLRRTNHDSWMPDTNDEKASRCCQMPPQCGHMRAPTESPQELRTEGMMGAREASQTTASKAQVSFFSKPETSSQSHGEKISNLHMVPLSQESESNVPAQTSAQSPAQLPVQSTAQNPWHISVHAPAHTQIQSPDWAPEHNPTQDTKHSPARAPEYSPAQAQTCSQPHTTKHTQGTTPEHKSAYTPGHTAAQVETLSQVHTSEHSSIHAPTYTQSDGHLTHAQAHSLAPASNSITSPTSFPSSAPAPVAVPTPAPGGVPVPVPTSTTTHVLTSIPSKPTAFMISHDLPTGHVICDVCKVNQNFFHAHRPKNSEYSGKILGALSRLQHEQGLVSSGVAEQTSKRHSEDGAMPPAGPSRGYLELGNIELKIPEESKDKVFQPQTSPHCSVHPCSSGRKNTDCQAPVYPKFLVYSQDASQPCFLSPNTAQSSLSTYLPPCTLSLPLIPPRSFVFPEPCSHQKPSTSMQTPITLPTSKSPQSIPASQFPISPQLTISHSLSQPQSSELYKNLDLNQDSSMQRKPCPSKDSRVHRKPGFTQDQGLHKTPDFTQDQDLHKNPGFTQGQSLHKNPDLIKDQGLHKSPIPTQDAGMHKNMGFTCELGVHKKPGFTQGAGVKNPGLSQDPGLHKNPRLTPDLGLHKHPDICKCSIPSQGFDHHNGPSISQESGPQKGPVQVTGGFRCLCATQPCHLHKSVLFTQTSDLQRTSDLMQDSGVYKNLNPKQDTAVCKDQGFSHIAGHSKSPGSLQDSGGYKSQGLTTESGLHNKSPGLTQSSGLPKGSSLTQDSGDYKNPDLNQESTKRIHKNSGPIQDSGLYKSPSLTQATEVKKRYGLTQEVGAYRSSEQTKDPSLHNCSGFDQGPGSDKGPAINQGSDLPKIPALTQESGPHKDSCLCQDPGLHKSPYLALGMDSVPVVSPLQTPKSTLPPMKSPVSDKAPQRDNVEQRKPSTSVPPNQNSSSSKAQTIFNDLQMFSEVPVLIELQPCSRRAGSQDWVHRPLDTVSPASQNYRQMSMPPKITWKAHSLGPGPRAGHVVFDARQRQLGAGRDKCEALSPRRLHQEASSNSRETKEWGYQHVMKTLEKEGTKVHQE